MHAAMARLHPTARLLPARFSPRSAFPHVPAGTVAATLAPGATPPDHDPFISRLTSGMCFDFSKQDTRIFLAGAAIGEMNVDATAAHNSDTPWCIWLWWGKAWYASIKLQSASLIGAAPLLSVAVLVSSCQQQSVINGMLTPPLSSFPLRAGTEDGWIHKCSVSYADTYMDSYDAHTGPVYQVQLSPYRPGLFLSCSSDWSMRLWQEGRSTPLLVFQSSECEINDVQWCPVNSTMFVSVTNGGKLELWDFSTSCIRPVSEHCAPNGVKLNCTLFSNNSPVVVCGGDDGSIAVLRVFGAGDEQVILQEQLDKLEASLKANVMKTTEETAGTQAAQ